MKTIEAVIDKQGNIRLLEEIKFEKEQRALVTILDNEIEKDEFKVVGSIELIDDDLEKSSEEISQIFNDAINQSADELQN